LASLLKSLKNLMLSVSLEAAELLELAQWKDDAALEAALAKPDFRRRSASSAPMSFSIS
jgi:hypothetical protein